MLKPLVFVDCETTGISLKRGKIIEIALIRVENSEIVESFTTLLNPYDYVPAEVTNLTGITSQMLENAPTFWDVKDRITELLKDAIFVAHNSAFDYSFIKKELRDVGISYFADQLCTVKLSRKLFPKDPHHNLDAIIHKFNFKIENRHRAYDDAKILYQFLNILEEELGNEKLEEVIKTVMKSKSLPLNLDKKLVENLPNNPGVYIFYAADGYPLYVGKSVNIKDRVMSHFYNSTVNSIEFKIAQQVSYIETKTTTGELGALLLESHLIKELQPLYNQKSRRLSSFLVLKSAVNENGYLTINWERMNILSGHNTENILGIFKSETQLKTYLAELTKKHNLCEKLLGLSKYKDECFNYQLGKCSGACKNKEKKEIYNLRFITAFAATKLKHWPFKNPIIVKEVDETENLVFHLFDKWCYLGSAYSDEEVNSKLENPTYKFDRDIYSILKGYIEKNKNQIYQLN